MLDGGGGGRLREAGPTPACHDMTWHSMISYDDVHDSPPHTHTHIRTYAHHVIRACCVFLTTHTHSPTDPPQRHVPILPPPV